MPHRTVRSRPLYLLLVLAVLFVAMPVAAGAQSRGEADAKEVDAYRLTIPRFDAWVKASLAMAKTHAGKVDDEGDDEAVENDAQWLDDIARKLDGMPEALTAIRGAGLSSREYAILSMVILQSVMADEMMKQYPTMEAPKINPQHLEFVRSNRAHVEKQMAALKAAGFGSDVRTHTKGASVHRRPLRVLVPARLSTAGDRRRAHRSASAAARAGRSAERSPGVISCSESVSENFAKCDFTCTG
jgi:hypothetical protein